MPEQITFLEIRNRLQEQGLGYEILELQDGFSILCTQWGGRIFGPFETGNSESVFWVNEAFRNKESFAEYIQNEEWNMGGDRVWTAPELAFFVKDRDTGFDSFIVQRQLDPGNYDLQKVDETVVLSQDVTLDAYQSKSSSKSFRLKRTINKIDDPLRNLSIFEKLQDGVTFCGFEQDVEIEDYSEDCELFLENWVLTQVKTPGRLIVPFTGLMEFVDYFEPIDEAFYEIRDNYMHIIVTGDRRYKVGFKSSVITGRSGYIGKLSDGRSYLLIRSYLNNPSSRYCCEPYDKPGRTGCSLFVYNDSGDLGGYAELENSGITISGDTGKKKSADTVSYWLYIGEEAMLNQIVYVLLGADLS